MIDRSLIGAIAMATALLAPVTGALAHDEARYPDFKGQWSRVGAPRWVTPTGPKAPLTPEYQKIYDENLADMKAGGPGNWPSSYCIPQGMPAVMNLYDPMEVVITADTTYVLISHINDFYRRIFTDGRPWPKEDDVEPTYMGYSIGHWVDTDGDGKYDVLEVETRYFKGPRAFELTGLPLHRDNKSVIKERIYRDKSDGNVLWDDITVIDNALTQPWTLHKKAVRSTEPRPAWYYEVCEEGSALVKVGEEAYFVSADGFLMPTKKGQTPPDPKYFQQPQR